MKKWMTCGSALTLGALTLLGCETGEAAEETGPALLTAEAAIGDLLIRAEATGTVEPVREVEVKSKASGEILRLLTDVGDVVERGTLLAEIDPRDVRNRYNQTEADLAVAQAQLDIARAQLERQQALLEADVITQTEFESATLSFANAEASLVRAQTNFDLAELQLADVRIRAPLDGTIIQKNVEEGSVIQSAASNVSGGTALFVMANLDDMQVRTLVDETDMGELKPGLTTSVSVEAYPDRTFTGTVDKIEPQAVVEQNVTMFPVIVSIDNRAGLLKPGMNAEVEIEIDEARNVVVVPNNAIVQTSDIGPAAMALGLDIEALDLSQFMRAGRGGFGGARPGGPRGGQRPPAAASATAGPDGEAAQGARPQTDAQAGAGERETTEQAADPRARIAQLRAQVESGEITPDSLRVAVQAMRGQFGGAPGGFGRPGGVSAGSAPPREARPAAVFVLGPDSIPEPRLVQIGLGDWDNTQIVSGLEDGETLVIVGAAQLQAQQDAFLAQMRSRMGGGSPFGGGGRPRGR
ncbi:MAG: efflux RND transporter periplasmic adaptor subunit [Gemmatimonadota bacterium]|nr:efflux RND transporter periplasmic adaptor subunit [Gemmatimonadota bacterium]